MNATDVELAWLAGLWDGEGAIGVTRSRSTGRLILIPQVQISMTHQPTVDRAVEIMGRIGCHAISYVVQEKMTHHKDAYHVGMRRTALVRLMAESLIPYAVTKLEQWQLAVEICDMRIERQGLDSKGNLRRGGAPGWAKPYSPEELALVDRLCELNARPGPVGGVPIPNRRPNPRTPEDTAA